MPYGVGLLYCIDVEVFLPPVAQHSYTALHLKYVQTPVGGCCGRQFVMYSVKWSYNDNAKVSIGEKDSGKNIFGVTHVDVFLGTIIGDYFLDVNLDVHPIAGNCLGKPDNYKFGELYFFFLDNNKEVVQIANTKDFRFLTGEQAGRYDSIWGLDIPYKELYDTGNYVFHKDEYCPCVVRHIAEGHDYVGKVHSWEATQILCHYYRHSIDMNHKDLMEDIKDIRKYVNAFDLNKEVSLYTIELIRYSGTSWKYASAPRDAYMRTLLPCFNESYTPPADYYIKHEPKSLFEEEAKGYRNKALKEYSKEKHYDYLLAYRMKCLLEVQSNYYKDWLNCIYGLCCYRVSEYLRGNLGKGGISPTVGEYNIVYSSFPRKLPYFEYNLGYKLTSKTNNGFTEMIKKS